MENPKTLLSNMDAYHGSANQTLARESYLQRFFPYLLLIRANYKILLDLPYKLQSCTAGKIGLYLYLYLQTFLLV